MADPRELGSRKALETYLGKREVHGDARRFYMDEGVHSFPKPVARLLPGYEDAPEDMLLGEALIHRAVSSGQLRDLFEHPYRGLDFSSAIDNIRRRFNPGEASVVRFFNNTDEILEILPRVVGRGFIKGPGFPNVLFYADWAGRVYTPLQPPLDATPEEALDFVVEKAGHRKIGKRKIVIIERPDIAGAYARLQKTAEVTQKLVSMGFIPVWDEATGDFMEDSESAIQLVASGAVVIRSTSKSMGIRGGYIVMPPEFAEVFQERHRPAMESQILPHLMAGATDKDIVDKYMGGRNGVRIKNAAVKRPLIRSLVKGGLVVAPTNFNTPTGLVGVPRSERIGGSETLFTGAIAAAGLAVVNGQFYNPTYPEIDKYNPGIDNGWFRFTTPAEWSPAISRRMIAASKITGQELNEASKNRHSVESFTAEEIEVANKEDNSPQAQARFSQEQ